MDIKEIIRRIGIIRTSANLSARALSLAIGKNASYIHLLESKKSSFEPSLSVLLDIIEACGSTPEEFFSDDIMQFRQDKQTLEFLKTLSPYQKTAIMNLYKK
ncbi:MAG: helix-turn-helix transcriptional regulator [Prevotella sp.]|nr:helix-turn-helix transcriptional regulator [Prevotella sp.]